MVKKLALSAVVLVAIGAHVLAGPLAPQGGTITSVTSQAGGGLSGGAFGGPVTLSLLRTCASGQGLVWSGSAWACGDVSALVSGTLQHLPYFTPDGHHLGDSPATYDSSTAAGTSPLTAVGTFAIPTRYFNAGGGEPAGNPTYATTGAEAFGRRSSAATNVITLATAADADNFPAGATVFASPNADATAPRVGSTTVVSSDSATGTVTLTSAAAITGFANSDYLFLAGSLTGIYSWRYVEYDVDPALSTGMSPASASVTLASQKALVTIGQVRRGMTTRTVCRTKAGGSTYYQVHNFGGGQDFFDTIWIDNTADSALVTLCPTVDTTKVYAQQISNDGVKFLRTHPSHVGAADETALTTDPLVPGTYARDDYGPNVARTINGTNYTAIKTGWSGDGVFTAYNTGSGRDIATGFNPNNAFSIIYSIGDNGTVVISPIHPLVDAGLNGRVIDRQLLSMTGTFPAVSTLLNVGVNINLIGNGSSAFEQDAVAIGYSAGYQGSSPTKGLAVTNNNAGSGLVYGVSSVANGAGTGTNVGGAFIASGASHNNPLYAGVGVPTAGRDSIAVLDNGSTGSDLIRTYNNGTLVLQQLGDGTTIVASQVYLDGSSLSSNYSVNATSTTNINYTGYQGGATQFRNLKIYDGKNAQVALFTASTAALDVTGNASGAALITGGSAGSKWSKGAGAPAIACSVGDLFSRTDGGVGTSLYLCTAANTWTADGVGTSSTSGTGTANTTTKWTGTSAIGNAWPLDDGTTWGVAGKFTIVEASGNVAVNGTLTADGGVRVFDVAGNGLSSTANRIDVNIAGASCATGTFVTTIGSTGTGTCSAGTLVEPNTVTVTGVSGTLNDYAPTGIATADILDITTSGSTTITGFSASQVSGQRLTIRNNAASTNGISISHGTGSTSANQITGAGLANWIVSVGGSMTFTYTGSKWQEESFAGTNMPALVTSGLVSIGTTLAVTGATTLSSTLAVTGTSTYAALARFGSGTDTSALGSNPVMITNTGLTVLAVRDSTNDVEAFVLAVSGGGAVFGSATNHQVKIQTNNTDAITISTAQNVTLAAALTVTTTINSGAITSTASIGGTDVTASGFISVVKRIVDKGATLAITSCGAGSSVVGGSVSAIISIAAGTTCTGTFGSSVTFNHAAICDITTNGTAKGFAFTTSTTGFAITSATAGQDYHVNCHDYN